MLTSENCLYGMWRVCCATLVALLTITPGVVRSQANAPSTLPPAAQEALNKGIIAAKVPDYTLAIRFFEVARKAAPQSAVVLLNLGLAESKIPGRELRAMAWFGAYLVANPAAPNAPAVREQIDALDVRNQSNISRLIKSVQDAAAQISGVEQKFSLLQTATLWRDFGDMATALKVAGLIQDPWFKGLALDRIAGVQAWNGDLAGAQKTADSIAPSYSKSMALISIAQAKVGAGDFAGAINSLATAQKSAALIDKEPGNGIQTAAYLKSTVQSLIASTQAEAGDIAGAQGTVGIIRDAAYESFALIAIANAQVKAGDLASAQRTLASAQTAAARIEYASHRSIAEEGIKSAQSTISNASNPGRQTAPVTQLRNQLNIGVSDWLKKLDDDDIKNDCPLGTEPFLDLAGHLRSLPKSDYAPNVFGHLRDTAQKIVGAQNIIAAMLKQQARR